MLIWKNNSITLILTFEYIIYIADTVYNLHISSFFDFNLILRCKFPLFTVNKIYLNHNVIINNILFVLNPPLFFQNPPLYFKNCPSHNLLNNLKKETVLLFFIRSIFKNRLWCILIKYPPKTYIYNDINKNISIFFIL